MNEHGTWIEYIDEIQDALKLISGSSALWAEKKRVSGSDWIGNINIEIGIDMDRPADVNAFYNHWSYTLDSGPKDRTYYGEVRIWAGVFNLFFAAKHLINYLSEASGDVPRYTKEPIPGVVADSISGIFLSWDAHQPLATTVSKKETRLRLSNNSTFIEYLFFLVSHELAHSALRTSPRIMKEWRSLADGALGDWLQEGQKLQVCRDHLRVAKETLSRVHDKDGRNWMGEIAADLLAFDMCLMFEQEIGREFFAVKSLLQAVLVQRLIETYCETRGLLAEPSHPDANSRMWIQLFHMLNAGTSKVGNGLLAVHDDRIFALIPNVAHLLRLINHVFHSYVSIVPKTASHRSQ